MSHAPAPRRDEGEREDFHPGSKRAVSYQLKGNIPPELPSGRADEPTWFLAQDEYVQTEDYANAWNTAYTTSANPSLVNTSPQLPIMFASVIEYATKEKAIERFDEAVASIASLTRRRFDRSIVELDVKAAGADRGWAAPVVRPMRRSPDLDVPHGLVVVLADRFVFGFDREEAEAADLAAVSSFVKTCLSVLKPPPSPSTPSGE